MQTTLATRRLGRSDLMLTRVGFGAWAVGGPGQMGWGSQDDDESVAAIHRAVDRGINWVDTAAVYGFGHSEEVVGRAVRTLPRSDRPLIFTKCGLVWDEDGEHPDMTPKSIRRECEDSLRRLDVEHIDLYQIHHPDENGPPIEEAWGTMLDLVEEGKVAVPGVSNFDTSLLDRCAAVGHVGSLQPPLSLINRDAAADLIPWCQRHDTGVIVYSPMQSGLLSGRFTRERAAALPEDDWRSRGAQFREPNLSRNLDLQEALRPVAQRHHTSVAAIAIAWTAAASGVTASIVGARSAEQVDGWVDAAGLELNDDDISEISTALVRTEAGNGPRDVIH